MVVTRSMTSASNGSPISGSSAEDSVSGSNGTAEPPKAVEDQQGSEKSSELRVRTALILLILIFVSSLSALLFVYCSFPNLDGREYQYLKFPKDIDDAKNLGRVLSRYKDKFFLEVLGGVFVTYLFLQTFAIPGSIFLSIVSGYLFNFPTALTLICFCSATGASFCYLLSYLAGRPLVYRYLPERANEWSKKVETQKSNIFSYILFLRITPFLPNWFINIVSPVIGVRLAPFWLGTFFGVAPPSFIAIQAGTTLQQLTSGLDALTFQSVALLVIFAFISILPVLIRSRGKKSTRNRKDSEGNEDGRCKRLLSSFSPCRRRGSVILDESEKTETESDS